MSRLEGCGVWPQGGHPELMPQGGYKACGVQRPSCCLHVSCPASLEKDHSGSRLVVCTLVPGLQRKNIDLGKGSGVESLEVGRTQGWVGYGAGIERGCWVSSSCSQVSTGDDGSNEFFKLKIPETI